MSEFVDSHPLGQDLPEFREEIHTLKMGDAHFARLMESYETLDKQIVRIEQGLEHIDDLELDGLKMQRVQLKDELVDMLRKAQSG